MSVIEAATHAGGNLAHEGAGVVSGPLHAFEKAKPQTKLLIIGGLLVGGIAIWWLFIRKSAGAKSVANGSVKYGTAQGSGGGYAPYQTGGGKQRPIVVKVKLPKNYHGPKDHHHPHKKGHRPNGSKVHHRHHPHHGHEGPGGIGKGREGGPITPRHPGRPSSVISRITGGVEGGRRKKHGIKGTANGVLHHGQRHGRQKFNKTLADLQHERHDLALNRRRLAIARLEGKRGKKVRNLRSAIRRERGTIIRDRRQVIRFRHPAHAIKGHRGSKGRHAA